MVRNTLLSLATMIALTGCKSLDFKGFFIPTGDVVEQRFSQSMEMTEAKAFEIIETPDEYMFYVCTDPHINKTARYLNIFNDTFRTDIEAAFGVILGDYTDIRDNLPVYMNAIGHSQEKHLYDHRIFHILGNHDIYFNGWDDFKSLIGPSVYWFEVTFPSGRDLYISLDTATATLGSKQSKWFRTFLTENRDKYRHCFILTHTNLFYTDNSQVSSGNMPIEESFALIDFLSEQKVTLVLQGHDHYREDLIHDNVRYTVVGTISDKSDRPEYLKVQVNHEGISFDWQYIQENQK